MKLSVASSPIEHIGEAVIISEYDLKKTAKAFQVLSSKLYKDKIAAVVRELSSNAYDSHVAAGCKERPFDIHLPTVLEPYFSVRDYGVGLTHTAIVTVFTTFFESTKDMSNDFIGALGLGSKTPFSITNHFNVYAYDGRECRTYECFVENGVPKVALKGTIASNQECGIEINVPVRPEDMQTFTNHAINIFKWFKVRPEIRGGTQTSIVIPNEPETIGSCWALNDSGGVKAIMGQICYPIDTKIIKTSLRNIAIYFDIGEIDIQAGREELSYDPDTIAAIQRRLEIAKTEIDAMYEDAFVNSESIFDAYSSVIDNEAMHPLIQISTPVWRGITLNKNTAYNKLEEFARVKPFGKCDWKNVNNSHYMFVTSTRDNRKFHAWRKPEYSGLIIRVDDKTKLEYIKSLFLPTQLPPEDQQISVKAKIRAIGSTPTEIQYKPEAVVDISTGGRYILTKNLKAMHPLKEDVITADEFESIQKIMLAEIPGAKDVALIPATRAKSFKNNWTNAYDDLRVLYLEKCKDRKWKADLEKAYMRMRFEPYANSASTLFSRHPDLPCDFIPFKQLLLECNTAQKQLNHWLVVAILMGHKFKKNTLQDDWLALMAKFPLVKLFISFSSGRYYSVSNIEKEEMISYVTMKSNYLENNA